MSDEPSGTLWRHGDFMKLWSAETVSQLGTQVTLLALPLTAVLVLHASPFQVGLLAAMETLPFILIGLPAGVWVDRLRRRPILIAGDLGRAVILGSIPLAYALGVLHMSQVYVVAFGTGICTVFFDVAYQSYLPSLVERDQLVDGNAKLEISRSGAQLAGPGLGGVLIEILSAPTAILIDSISYFGSALFVFLIRKEEPTVEAPVDGHPRMGRQIKEGLSYVLTHPLLRPIAACTSLSNLFSSMTFALLILFAVQTLGLKAGAIGLIFAIGNVGVLVGAFVAQRATKVLGLGWAIIGSAMVFSVADLFVPLATPATAFPMLVAAMAIGGFGSVVYNVNQVSLRQAITPERMQGRMNATVRFLIWGTLPIGAIIGGVMGGAIGIRPTLWVAGIGCLTAFVPPLLSPVRRLHHMPVAEDETSVAPDNP